MKKILNIFVHYPGQKCNHNNNRPFASARKIGRGGSRDGVKVSGQLAWSQWVAWFCIYFKITEQTNKILEAAFIVFLFAKLFMFVHFWAVGHFKKINECCNGFDLLAACNGKNNFKESEVNGLGFNALERRL